MTFAQWLRARLNKGLPMDNANLPALRALLAKVEAEETQP